MRTVANSSIQSLQLNCTSKEQLLDAQKHPEKYPDLIIRVTGFSAKFTSLSTDWQNEVISSVKRHSDPVFTSRQPAPSTVKSMPVKFSPEIEEKLKKLTVGSNVRHKKFGEGQVTKISTNDKSIHVMFSIGEKRFVYPDAFHMEFLEIN